VSVGENRLKVLSASKGEEMYTPGKLRHQRKPFSPQSEFRQDETGRPRVFMTLKRREGKVDGKRLFPFK